MRRGRFRRSRSIDLSPCEYQGLPSAHVVIRDITERKALERPAGQAAADLTHVRARSRGGEPFRLLAEAVPSMVGPRAGGYLDYVNRPTLDYLGCAFTDIRGLGWDKLVHPEDFPASGHAASQPGDRRRLRNEPARPARFRFGVPWPLNARFRCAMAPVRSCSGWSGHRHR